MSEPTPEILIRTARPEDWGTIRAICCKTANIGSPIDVERWPFFGELWVGPYQRLQPRWTYVAESGKSVIAYLTGCPDTAAHDREARWRVSLPLALRVLTGRFSWNGDTRRFLKRFFGFEESPEARFSAATKQKLGAHYPAHLHINADSSFRGGGVGRRLIERYCEDLKAKGIPGIHLYCGAAPVPFYLKTGFTELESIEFRPGVRVYCMVRALAGT